MIKEYIMPGIKNNIVSSKLIQNSVPIPYKSPTAKGGMRMARMMYSNRDPSD